MRRVDEKDGGIIPRLSTMPLVWCPVGHLTAPELIIHTSRGYSYARSGKTSGRNHRHQGVRHQCGALFHPVLLESGSPSWRINRGGDLEAT